MSKMNESLMRLMVGAEKVNVTNKLDNSSVTVAHHTIAPLTSKPVYVKHLAPWLEKGGMRLVDSGKIAIDHIGSRVSVERPNVTVEVLKEDDGEQDETNGKKGPDEGRTFDGLSASLAAGTGGEGFTDGGTGSGSEGSSGTGSEGTPDGANASGAGTDGKPDEGKVESTGRGGRRNK